MEVLFTATCQIIDAKIKRKKVDLDFKGHSYIWMLPIYGSIAFFARTLLPLVADYHFIARAFIYGVVILFVEYISGFVIKLTTGKCPWHYESKWALHGLIRFDYLPFWMAFGVIVEYYYFYF